jgi:PEGA domain
MSNRQFSTESELLKSPKGYNSARSLCDIRDPLGGLAAAAYGRHLAQGTENKRVRETVIALKFGSPPASLYSACRLGWVYLEGYFSMAALGIRIFKKLVVLIPGASFLFLYATFANSTYGQAVVEAAGATSVSATAASSAKPITMPKLPAAGGAASAHLVASSGPPAEDTNRKMLESHAGKDAGKLLLRATPVEAQIWVDGKIVGKTPMLLVLAPGKYQIEMRGARGQTGKSSVDLLPRETRQLAVKLEQLYPGKVALVR